MAVPRGKKRKTKKVKRVTRKKGIKRTGKRKVKRARPKARKKPVKKIPAATKGKEVKIGRVSHYFPHVKAGAVLVEKGTIAVGDTLHIKGHTTDFKQKVKSLQIDRVPIEEGSKGDEVGILIKSRVRINDTVYKIKT
jgi:putative protease